VRPSRIIRWRGESDKGRGRRRRGRYLHRRALVRSPERNDVDGGDEGDRGWGPGIGKSDDEEVYGQVEGNGEEVEDIRAKTIHWHRISGGFREFDG
jgi:hypothetical protein